MYSKKTVQHFMGNNARSPIERGLYHVIPFTIVRHKVVGDHGNDPKNPIRNPNPIGNLNPIGNTNNG